MSRSFLFPAFLFPAFLCPAALGAGLLASVAAFAQPSTVAVENVWSRAQIAGRNGAVYLTLTGKGEGDRLTGVRSPLSGTAEIHETIMDQGVMKMREVPGLAVAPGATVTLAPGGLHIMLMALKQPLTEGQTVSLTLVFEKAGEVPATALVAPAGARAPMSAAGHAAPGHGGAGQGHK